MIIFIFICARPFVRYSRLVTRGWFDGLRKCFDSNLNLRFLRADMFDSIGSSFGDSITKNDQFTSRIDRTSTGNCYNAAGTYTGQHTEEVPEVIPRGVYAAIKWLLLMSSH